LPKTVWHETILVEGARRHIEPSLRRLSGHQLFENGRSGYAEDEDHE
jgi:hypothetical protein